MKCPKCGFNSFEYLSSCKKCGNSQDAFRESLGLRPLVLAPALAGAASEMQPAFELQPDQAPFGREAADETFQWDTPVAATTSKQTESEYEEFDLNMGESEPDPPSSTFSFDEPQPTPDLPQAKPAEDSLFGDLSFGEPAEEAHDPFSPDAYEQSPQTAPAESTFGEFSFDDSLPELDPFAPDPTVTDNPFGEVAAATIPASPAAELPFDPFGEITPEELQQKSEPMATAVAELDLNDFLITDETTTALQEEEKKASPTGAQLAVDELDSLFGEIEAPGKEN